MAQQRSKESRPRQGEVLVYMPDVGKGEIYGSKEARTFPFDLKTSPGLNPDLLRPGIAVSYMTVSGDEGSRAVEVQLEDAGSLEMRLRATRKTTGSRPSRPAGVAAPETIIAQPEADSKPEEAAGEDAPDAAADEASEPEGGAAESSDVATASAEGEPASAEAAPADEPTVDKPSAGEPATDEPTADEKAPAES